MKKIEIHNQSITINKEYISLTDIAKYKNPKYPDEVIKNWIRNKGTINFLGIWERINNPYFNPVEFDGVKNEAGDNTFVLSPQRWIKLVRATGLTNKLGRYGGTFAHKDIAFEFASWISSEFKLYLIKEFQRLKDKENRAESLEWNVQRILTKINYRIHTDSIKDHIIIPNKISRPRTVYADEADILNIALFGITAIDWKLKNKNKEGNMRDHADMYQLICLSNLESLNSEFVRIGLSQQERLVKLNYVAISQMRSLLKNSTVKKLV